MKIFHAGPVGGYQMLQLILQCTFVINYLKFEIEDCSAGKVPGAIGLSNQASSHHGGPVSPYSV